MKYARIIFSLLIMLWLGTAWAAGDIQLIRFIPTLHL